MSLGFQHGLYLTASGRVFGVGKNTRFQLGQAYNKDSNHSEIFDKYQTAKELKYFDEEVKSVHAGKFHSLILTESNKLYGLGYNKYGQLGINSSLYQHSEEAMEVFTDGLDIDQIAVGAHHCLILDKNGDLYGFGARMNGQLDGVNKGSRQEQCSITPIKLPNGVGQSPDSRIVSIKANNLKSSLTTADGQVWFWGGYFYDGSKPSRQLK